MSRTTSQNRLLEFTAEIVSAHVSHNAVTAEILPSLIRQVYHSLANTGADARSKPQEKRPEPAVNPKRSVFPNYIVCLEDGKKAKMLRRHLAAVHGMTPEQYRERWELAANYPMVAPDYAATRSTLAKAFGLGRKSAAQQEELAEQAAVAEEGVVETPQLKARKAKAAGPRKGLRVGGAKSEKAAVA